MYCSSEATKYLVEVLLPINDVEQADCLDRLLEHIQKQPRMYHATDTVKMSCSIDLANRESCSSMFKSVVCE